MLLSKEKLQDASILDDLNNLKKDSTLFHSVSEKIKALISYCDNSQTIQKTFEALLKVYEK